MSPMQGLRFVDAAELQALGSAGGPVVVAFLATWNRRCQEFAGSYRALASEWDGRVPFVCIDVDESRPVAGKFDVYSVPTIVLLVAGAEVHREVGLDLAPLRERLKKQAP